MRHGASPVASANSWRGREECQKCGKFGHHGGQCLQCHTTPSTRRVSNAVVTHYRRHYATPVMAERAMNAEKTYTSSGAIAAGNVYTSALTPPRYGHLIAAATVSRRGSEEAAANGAGVELSPCGPLLQCRKSQQSYDSPSGIPYTLSYGCRPHHPISGDFPPSGNAVASPSYMFTSDPSVCSEDVSLGDPSSSFATTTRGRRGTGGAKQHVECSLLSHFPGSIPPQQSLKTDPTARLSVGAVEKELLEAGVEELVGILLELGSRHAEAAQFIEDKARLMAIRRSHYANTSIATRSRSSSVPVADTSHDSSWAHRREGRPVAGRLPASIHAADSSAVSSENVSHDQRIGSISATPEDQRGKRRVLHEELVEVPSESPLFSVELHPCLRWYGGCRYPTECAFAACPRNLCLSWVRGCCDSESQCGGVHQLPGNCSPEVRAIFDLNHGADRGKLGQQKLEGAGHQQWGHNHRHHQKPYGQSTVCVGEGKRSDTLDSVHEGNGAAVTFTPRGQIISDPTGVPGSFERFVREIPGGEGECNEGKEISSLRGCRGYQSWFCDCDEGVEVRLTPQGALSTVRSLNDDFGEAADPSFESFTADVGLVWSSPLKRSGSCSIMACSADCEPEIPSFNSRTRSASPIDA
ncbi:hypothetical protein, conserved [Trypanosoma brucei brucei TREU927]|uniref:CCHC-type domain-containing protein n=1 Tax=Trypanosoma brucei brucei (strain 927/4 GUTat10.1) TaxID=185431 RepID=Q57XL6_TRYB2|nr:hypothetical protein, conserved [Trypanosoma brucei brucei TREU927]AAX69653.1 hypothetical protein, conserved [Trypanosoma brucei]AAZ12322.1 hypothetical protein, conserved [Trypanosoma brucei brucei TREU927]